MRLRSTTVVEFSWKVYGAVEVQGTIVCNVDVQSLVVAWCVQDTNITSLNEVVCDNEMLLVWGNCDKSIRWLLEEFTSVLTLQVVRAECGLDLIRVVEALHVVEV